MIVPVYNERNTVGEIIRRMRLVELPIEREIVVVDDGSVDGTDRVLGALEDSTVKVVTHADNRGKGAAVRTGVAAARGDVVLIQDADLEYDPHDWPKLLAPLLQGRTKVVYGSRYIGEREVVSLGRWAGDRSLALLTAVLFNATLTDVETGYKAIDRKVFDSLDLTAERIRLRAGDHGQAPPAPASASSRFRSTTPAARATRVASSPGGTGWPRAGRCFACGPAGRPRIHGKKDLDP